MASRRLLLVLLRSFGGYLSRTTAVVACALYFASDTLYLVTFHCGVSSCFSSSVLRFHDAVESFSVLAFSSWFFFLRQRVSCSRSTAHGSHTGVINYFAFLLMNMYSKKKELYTIFYALFLPSDTTALRSLLLGGQFLPA